MSTTNLSDGRSTCLAAAPAVPAGDQEGPSLGFQPLVVPEFDDRMHTPSMHAYVDTPMWSKPLGERSWALYLGDSIVPRGAGVSPHAAPARAESLAGISSAYVSVCEFEPLRDEVIIYARRLVQAGVATELHPYPGTFLWSLQVVPDGSVGRRMRTEELAALRRGLRVGPTSQQEGMSLPSSDGSDRYGEL